MSDEGIDTDTAPDLAAELDDYKQRVVDLEAELETALREEGYFITMTCATSHLQAPSCDCDERIGRINVRLGSLR